MHMIRRAAARDRGPTTLVRPETADLSFAYDQAGGSVKLTFYQRYEHNKDPTSGHKYEMRLTTEELRKALLCTLRDVPEPERSAWAAMLQIWERRVNTSQREVE